MDRLRTLTLGGVGLIPVAGSAASAIVELLWRSSYEKRVETFLTMAASKLDELDGQISDLPGMLQREVSISIGLAAASAAAKTHDHRKLEYLATAVAGVTSDTAWDAKADFAMLLLQLVDDLTATHVQVLAAMSEQEKWKQRSEAEFGDKAQLLTYSMVASMFPEHDPTAIQGILSDLAAKNLMANANTWFAVTEPSPGGPTELGLALLAFIGKSPSGE
ncbi:MAG TPA: hypothetical protein VHX38_17285 [Pseudonocardiaceae bacterium]|nr:hypothetical protein [Pseudonocardiaceae bacterium]